MELNQTINLRLSNSAKALLSRAIAVSEDLRQVRVFPEHLLLATSEAYMKHPLIKPKVDLLAQFTRKPTTAGDLSGKNQFSEELIEFLLQAMTTLPEGEIEELGLLLFLDSSHLLRSCSGLTFGEMLECPAGKRALEQLTKLGVDSDELVNLTSSSTVASVWKGISTGRHVHNFIAMRNDVPELEVLSALLAITLDGNWSLKLQSLGLNEEVLRTAGAAFPEFSEGKSRYLNFLQKRLGHFGFLQSGLDYLRLTKPSQLALIWAWENSGQTPVGVWGLLQGIFFSDYAFQSRSGAVDYLSRMGLLQCFTWSPRATMNLVGSGDKHMIDLDSATAKSLEWTLAKVRRLATTENILDGLARTEDLDLAKTFGALGLQKSSLENDLLEE